MLYGNFFFFVLGGWRAKRRLRDASNVSEKAAKIFGFSSVTPCRPQQCIKNCLTAKKICFTHGTCLSWFSVIVSYYAHLCVAIFSSLLWIWKFCKFPDTFYFVFFSSLETRECCAIKTDRIWNFCDQFHVKCLKQNFSFFSFCTAIDVCQQTTTFTIFFLYHNLCDMKQSHKMSVSNARATVWLQIL